MVFADVIATSHSFSAVSGAGWAYAGPQWTVNLPAAFSLHLQLCHALHCWASQVALVIRSMRASPVQWRRGQQGEKQSIQTQSRHSWYQNTQRINGKLQLQQKWVSEGWSRAYAESNQTPHQIYWNWNKSLVSLKQSEALKLSPKSGTSWLHQENLRHYHVICVCVCVPGNCWYNWIVTVKNTPKY